MKKRILLANPRGFCAGVDRAILIVEKALSTFGKPIYVRHEVVHNKFVVTELKLKGAIFVETLDEVPDDQIVIFSAHGVPKSVEAEAKRRGLRVFDATCPLVTKVHIEVSRADKHDTEVILIGHKGHPEVTGTMGQYQNKQFGIHLVETVDDVQTLKVINPENLLYVTQTTLSIHDTKNIVLALKEKYPSIRSPKQGDICYATENRQNAVKAIAEQSDLVLVVGSMNSSNSNRLKELAESTGTPAYLIDRASEISTTWLKEAKTIGITAGASAPEVLVSEVTSYLTTQFSFEIEETKGIEETIHFALPKALR